MQDWWFGPQNAADWVSAVITAIASLAALITLFVLRAQTIAARDAAIAARTSADSVMLAERAYVKMANKPPGLEFQHLPTAEVLFGDRDVIGCGVWIEIRNHGRTPARITDSLLKFQPLPTLDALPAVPDYSDALPRDPLQFLLVANEAFAYQGGYVLHNWLDVNSKAATLYVYGYVDYIDAFGQRHRAGFGRSFDPNLDRPTTYLNDELPSSADRNNLIPLTGAGYNYDRPRKRGEGIDWDS